MLLCARYFVDMWQKFIEKAPCYRQHQNFLTHESVDIISFLVNGLILLIIIHRDYFPHVPLLPWLHSSEACKHFFGMARQIVKDFTMLDFYQMVPKLLLRLREAVFNSRSDTKEEMTARASGYNHTYINMQKLDIVALGHFPMDMEIQRITK
ncbi:hypothetical protein BDP27DRAFT_1534318, partial [Rhodocollybia butyracea]